MCNDSDRMRLDGEATLTLGWTARMRFFVRRHPVALAIVGGLFAGGCGALFVVLAPVFGFAGNGPLFVAFAAIGFATFVTGFMPLFVRWDRAATVSDIAAAFASATMHERPHLVTRIEACLVSHTQSTPMTIFQLVLMFDEVRAEHGNRARRKRLFNQRDRTKQRRFVTQLQGFVGEPDGEGQRAL